MATSAALPDASPVLAPLDDHALDRVFREARTFHKFTDRPVDDATLRSLYELYKWGPTAMNAQPARVVFVRSRDAKERLRPALAAGNVEKTMAAPVTAVVAFDTQFFEHLPAQYPASPGARDRYARNPPAADRTATFNATLQAAYLIVAARALGLDAGPMGGFDAKTVDAAFFPDGRWKSLLLVNLGWGDPSGTHPRGPRLPFDEAVRVV